MHRIMDQFIHEDQRIFDGVTNFVDALSPGLELPGIYAEIYNFIAFAYL
jgi:hypothetical protein